MGFQFFISSTYVFKITVFLFTRKLDFSDKIYVITMVQHDVEEQRNPNLFRLKSCTMINCIKLSLLFSTSPRQAKKEMHMLVLKYIKCINVYKMLFTLQNHHIVKQA